MSKYKTYKQAKRHNKIRSALIGIVFTISCIAFVLAFMLQPFAFEITKANGSGTFATLGIRLLVVLAIFVIGCMFVVTDEWSGISDDEGYVMLRNAGFNKDEAHDVMSKVNEMFEEDKYDSLGK